MGKTLGPVEAAHAIGKAFHDGAASRADPEMAHAVKFLKEVCVNLGVESSPENVAVVHSLLGEHDIDLPHGTEYPKWVGDKIVNDADEEAALAADDEKAETKQPEPEPEPEPEPAEAKQPASAEPAAVEGFINAGAGQLGQPAPNKLAAKRPE